MKFLENFINTVRTTVLVVAGLANGMIPYAKCGHNRYMVVCLILLCPIKVERYERIPALIWNVIPGPVLLTAI